MPSFAFTDAKVTVNAVDLSSYVRQATLNVQADQLDDTAMGDSFRSRIGGLKDWSVNLEFNTDYAAGAVDATLWPLLGTVVTVTIKPTGAATSATNPIYSGPVLVSGLTPVGGSVGDLATNSVTWQGAGALARASS
ncbi:radical SAM protein [Micromonospora aurantiaca (nom. illeg.)]|uniref:radical SAM protein n=1 Tax=Micromonospora aurantiaca (nom. illeg.) TaxID=47850 RepID=UPI0033DDAFBE